MNWISYILRSRQFLLTLWFLGYFIWVHPGILERLSQAPEQKKVASDEAVYFFELDERFHRTLAEAAGKSYAWNVVEGVKSQMDRARLLSFDRFPIKKLVKQHADVVEAIAIHDVAAADAALRNHLSEILIDLPAITESWPEYFEDEGQ